MRILTAVIAVFLLLAMALPTAVAKDDDLPRPHADEDVKPALERFKADYKSDDFDERLRILRWIGMYRHPLVVKELKKVWLKEDNIELLAVAAEGLGGQLSNPKDAGKLLVKGLDKYRGFAGKDPQTEAERMEEDLQANVLVQALKGLGKLGFTPDWKTVKGFIDHNNDDVAIAMIDLCAELKEYRALPIIYEWFEHYPDGVSWSGGSVKVDTGAAGNKDANAAKAKWRAKYGSRARKARPDAFAAMVACVGVLTGQEIEKRDQLKEWMDENKVFLKRHGV